MRVIEFSHPGGQFKLSARSKKNGVAFEFDAGSTLTGTQFWNNEPTHFRKFIRMKGRYLLNINKETILPEVQQGDLLFWGEFEAQSRFKKQNSGDQRLFPNALHEPFLSLDNQGFHNTDPFVFGTHFYYSNCKQHIRNMNALKVGSVILFGTEYSEGFALDTVFVVGSQNSVKEYLGNQEAFPAILRKTTLDKLYNPESKLTLYQGQMYTGNTYLENPTDIFSFVPCMPYNSATSQGFSRPFLNYSTFQLQRPGAGTVLYDILQNPSEEEVADYWKKVVAEVIAQGYSLGVQMEEPPIMQGDIPSESEIKQKGCKPNFQVKVTLAKACC